MARVICEGACLAERGRGVRFAVDVGGGPQPAFVVRYRGRVRAYLNRCAHRGVELDWEEGEFFDAEGEFLICATHGARYDAATGRCAGGPCGGAGLVPVAVEEIGGEVRLLEAGQPARNGT